MFRILGFLSLVAIASAGIPDGYTLQVTPFCTNGSSNAEVQVFSDLDVKIQLNCKSSVSSGEITELKPKKSFTLYYSGKRGCTFKTANTNSKVYSITLELYWKEPGQTGNYLQTQKEVYAIVCSTEEKKDSESAPNTVNDYPFAPERKGEEYGSEMSGIVTLTLLDVEGKELTGNVALGKKVYLKADPVGQAFGIMPVDCWGEDNANNTYTILKGGCGDGIVLKTDEGFTSEGMTALSRFFRFFRFDSSNTMMFKCTFVKCNGKCALTTNKDSCIKFRRRRRDVSQVIHGSRAMVLDNGDGQELKPRFLMASTESRRQLQDSEEYPAKTLIIYSSPAQNSMASKESRIQRYDSEEYPAKTLIIYSSPKSGHRERQQLQSDDYNDRVMFMMVAILSCFIAVALMMSLYVCTKQERLRSLDKLAQKA